MLDDPGHFLSCPLLRPLARVRHDRLVRLLATLIQRAAGPPLSSLVILRTSVPISTPFSLMPVLCLMSVAHPSAPSRVRLAPGSALKYRENGKISAYEPLAKEAGNRFVAFAFESFGGLGSAAISFLRDLASYAKESFLGCDYVLSVSALAVLLQKGNAEMLALDVISNGHTIR